MQLCCWFLLNKNTNNFIRWLICAEGSADIALLKVTEDCFPVVRNPDSESAIIDLRDYIVLSYYT